MRKRIISFSIGMALLALETTAFAEGGAGSVGIGMLATGAAQYNFATRSAVPSTPIFVELLLPMTRRTKGLIEIGGGPAWEHGHTVFAGMYRGGARWYATEHNAFDLTVGIETLFSKSTSHEVALGGELAYVRFITHAVYGVLGVGTSYAVVKPEPLSHAQSAVCIVGTFGLGMHIIDL